MVSVVDVITTYIRPYSKTILIVASVIFFAIAAYYFYDKWNIPRANKYQDIYQPNNIGQDEAVIYFFLPIGAPIVLRPNPNGRHSQIVTMAK